MASEFKFPPHLPDQYRDSKKYWVGSNDPYSPQLTILAGEDPAALEEAARSNGKVVVQIYAHTADMAADEPDDNLGPHEVTVKALSVNADFSGSVNFLGEIATGRFAAALLWVWEYTPFEEAGADFAPFD